MNNLKIVTLWKGIWPILLQTKGEKVLQLNWRTINITTGILDTISYRNATISQVKCRLPFKNNIDNFG